MGREAGRGPGGSGRLLLCLVGPGGGCASSEGGTLGRMDSVGTRPCCTGAATGGPGGAAQPAAGLQNVPRGLVFPCGRSGRVADTPDVLSGRDRASLQLISKF